MRRVAKNEQNNCLPFRGLQNIADITQFPPSWPSITICWPGNLKLPPAAASRVFCHLAHSVSSQRVPGNPWPLIGWWLVTLICDWTSLVSAQARGQWLEQTQAIRTFLGRKHPVKTCYYLTQLRARKFCGVKVLTTSNTPCSEASGSGKAEFCHRWKENLAICIPLGSRGCCNFNCRSEKAKILCKV